MRLEYNNFLSDIECPSCGTGFDIDNTHEEHIADCYGEINCLKCGVIFEIETTVKHTVKLKGVKS